MSKVAPYEFPQVIAQIPPPPMDVPMPIRKALQINGESKVVCHLIHGEYKLTNTSWPNIQKNTVSVETKSTLPSKEGRRPRGFQYRQKKQLKKTIKPESTMSTASLEFSNK